MKLSENLSVSFLFPNHDHRMQGWAYLKQLFRTRRNEDVVNTIEKIMLYFVDEVFHKLILFYGWKTHAKPLVFDM